MSGNFMFPLLRLFRNFSSISSKELKPSIFTGKADFYETLYFLDDIVLKMKDLKSSSEGIEFNWLNREKLQNKLGFEMSLLEYRQIRQRLSKIQQAAAVSPNILEFLRVFGEAVRTETDSELLSSEHAKLELKKESSLGWIDELGRAIAIGRRKSSTAKVMLVPGAGEFRVNGVPLVDYFPRPRDIYEIANPFKVTDQFGKFNVWALVKSGGHTGNHQKFCANLIDIFTILGQSGAITLGLAKALAVYNPEFKAVLDSTGCLRRDPRRVERKKPGQEKARKKFTWVKR